MNRHPHASNATLAMSDDEAEPLLPAGSRLTPEMPAREFIG